MPPRGPKACPCYRFTHKQHIWKENLKALVSFSHTQTHKSNHSKGQMFRMNTKTRSSSSGLWSKPFSICRAIHCAHRLAKTAARQQRSGQINTNEFWGWNSRQISLWPGLHKQYIFIKTCKWKLSEKQQPGPLDGKLLVSKHLILQWYCYVLCIVLQSYTDHKTFSYLVL